MLSFFFSIVFVGFQGGSADFLWGFEGVNAVILLVRGILKREMLLLPCGLKGEMLLFFVLCFACADQNHLF